MASVIRKSVVALVALAILPGLGPLSGTETTAAAAPPADNPIVVENRLPGHPGWRIPWSGHSIANDVTEQIKGFASETSVNRGGSLDLKVTDNQTGQFSWNVFRLGWYGSVGGRLMRGGFANAPVQAACPVNSTTGQIGCSWSTTVTLDIPPQWTSGIYVVILTNAARYQNYIVFTVRDDARTNSLVHVQPVNTYQAYNNYPNDGATGKSLYAYNSYGANTVGGSDAAVKVTFDRPYANHGAGHLFFDDAPMVRYLESRGFDVTYATDVDLHRDPSLAAGQRALMSVGHDEYWSAQMFTAAETARDAGVDVAFFGGNDVYWQVRYEAWQINRPNRVLVCYRLASIDPVTDPTQETVRFREAQRPEQPLIGMMWPADPSGVVGADASWVVNSADHWFYRGTGLGEGAQIPTLVGGEADKRLSQYPSPQSTSFAVLARSPYRASNGSNGLQESTLYQAPSGAHVFGAGTLRYTRGVGGEGGTADARARAMTTNLLGRMSGFSSTVTTQRVAGTDRYETASLLSASAFAPGVEVAYVATGRNFPDALAASAATRGRGPVMLVDTNSIPQSVQNELTRLAPHRVVVVGSVAVVSDAVLNQLRTLTGADVVRRSGSDRYATAVEISKDAFAPGVPVVYVAAGLNFPDALAGGAAGAQFGGPVLLTQTSTIDTLTLGELRRLAPARIVVIGSTAVVSASVEQTLRGVAPTARRAGSDRYETSREVSRDVVAAGGSVLVTLATGADFPDALSAGPVVAASGGALVLTQSALDAATAEEVVRNDPERVIAAGGEAVVPAAVLNAARALFDNADGVTAPAPRVDLPLAERAAPLVTGEPPVELEPPVPTELPWLTPERDG